MFKFRKARREIEIGDADLSPDILVGSLLDRSSTSVTGMLDRFRADEVSLEKDIAELTERLRQTRVAIKAFEVAGAILDDGKDVAVAPPAKIGRLVPREVPAGDTIVHVHKDIRA